jgi:hypothetical protein
MKEENLKGKIMYWRWLDDSEKTFITSIIKDIVKAQLQPLENKVEGLEQQIQQLKQLLHFICKTVLPPDEPLKDANVFNK